MLQLTDYSLYYKSSGHYTPFIAHSPEGIQQAVAAAYKNGQPVRVRGRGHSMNGSSLPRQGELLLHSESFNHFRFDNPGTVTIGSGAAIWDADQMLRQYGFELYVVNDGGGPASSVGGYLSAGGFGEKSNLHGGFWETVEHIVWIDGTGKLITSAYGDAVFPWLFGSSGQLGFIYEVCVKIKPLSGPIEYPAGKKGTIIKSKSNWPVQLWYSLFTTPQYADEALQDLHMLRQVHRRTIATLPVYKYEILFKKFNPPLVFPAQESFMVLGIWGHSWDDKLDTPAVRLLEQDFSELVLEKPYFRRYIQAELTFEGFDYRAYFGEKVSAAFSEIKAQSDPKNIFGKGMIKQWT